MATGLPVDAVEGLARVIEDLRRRVQSLENEQSRVVSFGNTYRVQVSGQGNTAQLLAIRSADGNTKILAP
jgi:transcription elongation GreA/GreB family factor